VTNEAAERLHAIVGTRVESTLLDEALAAERHATVERIRAQMMKIGRNADLDVVYLILDEEAAR
jgi:hypothetical protein